MLTALDLRNIDEFLQCQQAIINQPKTNKKILNELRQKIAQELKNIPIRTEANK